MTSCLWPVNVRRHAPVRIPHFFAVWSHDPVYSRPAGGAVAGGGGDGGGEARARSGERCRGRWHSEAAAPSAARGRTAAVAEALWALARAAPLPGQAKPRADGARTSLLVNADRLDRAQVRAGGGALHGRVGRARRHASPPSRLGRERGRARPLEPACRAQPLCSARAHELEHVPQPVAQPVAAGGGARRQALLLQPVQRGRAAMVRVRLEQQLAAGRQPGESGALHLLLSARRRARATGMWHRR